MLPENIPLALGEIILFIGRIVWIVNNGPDITTDRKYQVKLKRDVWEGASMEYYEMIKALEVRPFSYCEFEMTIEECRTKLTKAGMNIRFKSKIIWHLSFCSFSGSCCWTKQICWISCN